MTDHINRPAHYTHGTIEPIEVIESWRLGFHLGNVVKYVARADHKGNRLDDLRKAAWYLAREIEQMEATDTKPATIEPTTAPFLVPGQTWPIDVNRVDCAPRSSCPVTSALHELRGAPATALNAEDYAAACAAAREMK